jgi:flagellar P-ring protein FlgI
MRRRMQLACLVAYSLLASTAWGTTAEAAGKVRIGDLTTVEGVRDNALVGYGMVVGLKGTGDRQQTVFSTQMLANILQKMGVQVPASTLMVKNVAAVFVTANLPPFAAPGTQLDVTVGSIGDAKSLEGGLLLLTSLIGPDGQAYASAQGPLSLGGYMAGAAGNSKLVNHPTVGRIPHGALVERPAALDLRGLRQLSLLLREADFTESSAVAAAINQILGKKIAAAIDSRRIDLDLAASGQSATELLARVEQIEVEVHTAGKVVINERTGTIVMGSDVRLSSVSILHGNLTIEISTQFQVSQPLPKSGGETMVVPETEVRAVDSPTRRIELPEGASVEQLVNGLQAIGATAHDVVAILQAIQAAGALHAELEIL